MTFVLLQFATLRLPSAKVMAYTYLVPSWVILWELALGRAALGYGMRALELEEKQAAAACGQAPLLAAWRAGRPVYDQAGHWIGMATSGAWSPPTASAR